MPTKTKPKPKPKKDVTVAELRSTIKELKKVVHRISNPGPQSPTEEAIESRAESYLTGVTPAGYVVGKHEAAVLREMAQRYEAETGAIASQTRLIDFIRWWEEREKNGNTS